MKPRMPKLAMKPRTPKLEILPLTPDRWDDVVRLFGPRGACAGCWCMFPRRTGAEIALLPPVSGGSR